MADDLRFLDEQVYAASVDAKPEQVPDNLDFLDKQVKMADVPVFGSPERKTFGDAFSKVLEMPYGMLPVLDLLEIRDSYKVFKAARAAAKGTETLEQADILSNYMADQARGQSWGYKTASMALHMIPYMLTFNMVGGAIQGGAKGVIMQGSKAGAKAAAKKTLRGGIEKAAAKATGSIVKKLGGVADDSVGMAVAEYLAADYATPLAAANVALKEAKLADTGIAAARAATRKAAGSYGLHIAAEAFPRTILMSNATVDNMIKNMTPMFALSPDEEGNMRRILVDEGDDFLPALAKAFGDNYIENFSESTAEYVYMLKHMFGKPGAKSALKAGFLSALSKKAEDTIGVPRTKAMKRIISEYFVGAKPNTGLVGRMGWNGVFGELGEEVIGGALRQATGISPVGLPTFEDASAMAVSFMLNPMAIGGAVVDSRFDAYMKNRHNVEAAVAKVQKDRVDLMANPDAAKDLRKVIGTFFDYHPKEDEKLNNWDKFVRIVAGNRIHASIGQDLAEVMSEENFQFNWNVLESAAKVYTSKDTKAIDNVIANLMKIRVTPESQADMIRTAAVTELNYGPQYDDGKLAGKTTPHSPLAPLVYVTRPKDNPAITKEQYDAMIDAVPWLVDVDVMEGTRARVRGFDEEGFHTRRLLPEVSAENVDVLARIAGIDEAFIEYEGRHHGTLTFRSPQDLIDAVQAKVDVINQIAIHMPKDARTHLTPLISILDTPEGFSGQPVADIVHPVNEEGQIMLSIAAMWNEQNQELYITPLAAGSDIAEDVLHAIIQYRGSQVDQFVKDTAKAIRAQAPGSEAMNQANDQELFTKVVKVLRFGHQSNDINDLAYFITKRGVKISDAQGKEIDAYLQDKAFQHGFGVGIFKAISAEAGVLFELGGEWVSERFQPVDTLENYVAKIREAAVAVPQRITGDELFASSGDIPFSLKLEWDSKRHQKRYDSRIRAYLTNDYEDKRYDMGDMKWVRLQLEAHGQRITPYLEKFFSELYPTTLGGEERIFLGALGLPNVYRREEPANLMKNQVVLRDGLGPPRPLKALKGVKGYLHQPQRLETPPRASLSFLDCLRRLG